MKLKNLLILLATSGLFVSALSGCDSHSHNKKPDHDPKDDPIQPYDHLLDVPTWATPADELDSYENDVFYYQNTADDVGPDYTFDIKLDRDTYTGSLGDYIRVYDSTRIEHSLRFEATHDRQYKVSPNVPYDLGRYYTVEIKDNAPFHFAGKDPTMKEFHFDTASLGDKEVYNVKNTVHRFLLSEVISKQEIDTNGDNQTRLMVVKHPLYLSEGDHFLFWNGTKMDRHSFFGKFHHETSEHGVTMVYYTNPDLGEIFGEDGLEVSYQNYVPDEIYDLVLASENEIKENLENSPELEEFLYESYLLYEPDRPHMSRDALDWIMAMEAIQIRPEFGFYWPGWSFSVTIRLTIPFEYATLTLMWQYYRKSTMKCDASISLRECLGVPYWADLAVDVSETVDSSFRFCIVVGDTLPHPEEDDDDEFLSLMDYAKEKTSDFEDADKKMQTIKDSGKDGVKFDGKTLTIKLGTGRFPIGWVFDIFIDFNFTIKLEASVMISFSYTEHSENSIISYRSGDEDKSSHSVSALSSTTKTIMLIGQIGIDVGLFFRIGVGVCGLEDFISFSINANVGMYLTIGGYGMWTWTVTPTTKKFDGLGGFIFEVGWFATVGIRLVIFFIDLSVNFVAIRNPFFSTTTDQYFIEPPVIQDNTIHLETHKVSVNSLHILTFNTFSATFMKEQIKDFDPEVELDYADDSGEEVHGKVFNFRFKNGQYIRYDSGYFLIDNDCPCKFQDTLYVDVPSSLYRLREGENHFIEVTIDFFDCQARPVYFDDEFIGYYRWGDKVEIPGCPEDREAQGERFYGWQLKGTNYYYGEGENYIVPVDDATHQKVEFTSSYYDIIYHNVTFYDGEGNIICTQRVEEGTDAEAPSDELRDANMPEGAIFVGWSTDFKNVYYDLEVYAIYVYIDKGGN